MGLLTGNSVLCGYGLSHRQLCLTLRHASLVIGWNAADTFLGKKGEWRRIDARATLGDDDSLVMIGDRDSKTAEIPVAIRPYAEANELSEPWEQSMTSNAASEYAAVAVSDDEKQVGQFLVNCYAKFAERPPSAHVFYFSPDEADDEAASWMADVYIPEPVFSRIAGAVEGQRDVVIHVRVELNPTLVRDAYARAVDPTMFGLVRFDTGANAHGWVTGVSWQEERPSGYARGGLDSEVASPSEPPVLSAYDGREYVAVNSASAALVRLLRAANGLLLLLALLLLADVVVRLI